MPSSGEQAPLLSGGFESQPGFIEHHRIRLVQNVSKKWADIVLLLLTFDTGLIDGSAISTWNAFVSMQTGNTIYVGLGLAEPSGSNRWLKALVSIIAFMLGSLIFSICHRRGGPRKRWVLITSYFVQTLCIIVAATLVTFQIVDRENMHWSTILALSLLSFQSAGQAIAAQGLQYSEIPTIVLTSVMRDLMADPALFAAQPAANPKRNRRALAIVLACAGAAVSKIIGRSPAGLAGSLWTSAGIKALAALSWLLWAPEQKDEE